MSSLATRSEPVTRLDRDHLPAIGSWWYVQPHGVAEDSEDFWRELMCVVNIGSNHVAFERPRVTVESRERGGGEWLRTADHRVHFDHLLACIQEERDPQAVFAAQLKKLEAEFRDGLKQLVDTAKSANLVSDEVQETAMLPSVVRRNPEEQKALLLAAKASLPEQQAVLAEVAAKISELTRCQGFSDRAKMGQVMRAFKAIDDRLFVFELYSGLQEHILRIRDGEPAPIEEPVCIRQLMLFMDEETLIDWDKGGMDFENLEDFDAWVAKPENLDRVLPELKGIVAFQVRRHEKDYGPIRNMADAFRHSVWHDEDKKTYLLMRNGGQVFRLSSSVNFRPALVPKRTEFTGPLMKDHYWSDEERKPVTMDDVNFDDHYAPRKKAVFDYNRVLFLMQGLLDRSKVFHPHPPIDMTNPDHLSTLVRIIRDDEDVLGAANPPDFDEYRAAKNAQLKVGDTIYSWYRPGKIHKDEEDEGRKEKVRPYGANPMPELPAVSKISRDRKHVTVSWPYGTRTGYEKRDRFGGYYGKWGTWPVNKMLHETIAMSRVFNVSAYVPGEYKQFICDRYQKGRYLEWAPALLRAEQFKNPQAGKKLKPEADDE